MLLLSGLLDRRKSQGWGGEARLFEKGILERLGLDDF